MDLDILKVVTGYTTNTVFQKEDIKLTSISPSNLNRFWKFFHWHIHQ